MNVHHVLGPIAVPEVFARAAERYAGGAHPAMVQARLPRLLAIWAGAATLPSMFTRLLLASLPALLLAAPVQASPQDKAPLTLEEAVAKVQQDTGGKILSADPRKFGRRTEYRIKVLTPEGHVRTISISSDAPRAGAGKHPAGNGAGKKEKH
ncbi:PepSY domain-containing protein [Frateuria sp. STR12]|uniref:PepSY domain-containing protein n=1 Tax=Frateuria hangzhouensis TaxID=2995589 RepID=UPI002260D84C|nr:PepSY domain-containing protein [Frateuria sp. STR12]MCX7514587.1 PepSY domain-containing protein [Frateuria sp. STR12]